MWRDWLFLLTVVALVAGLGDHTLAQGVDARGLGDRMERLERDLSALQRQIYRGGAPAPVVPASPGPPRPIAVGDGAEIELRLQRMSDDLRDMRGQFERVGHAADELRQRIDKLVDDVDFRLSALERQGRDPAPAVGQPPARVEPGPARGTAAGGARREPEPPAAAGQRQTANLPSGSPIEQYNSARAMLAESRYDEAEQSFRTFLDQYSKHALAENAQYWLSETYYVRKKYQEAATGFFDGFSKYPKGAKAPDNLLKLSRSLVALDKGREACAALDRLLREFPDADELVRRRASIDRERLGCR
ncbi:MAG: tol-pal system protein YbgF [Alphaproteobacteria bacterium]|nr:tol-pal system protein YbgF [Alphaproteobacteria bacterium]